jgi:hypothetical protein
MLVIIAPPALMLLWLGWRLSQSDRALLEKHALDARQAAGQAAVLALEQLLTEAATRASSGPVPDGMVWFVRTSAGLAAQPTDRVHWLPSAPPMLSDDPHLFADAEALEFQGAADRALSRYLQMARSASGVTRAGALLRAARVHRRKQNWDEALAAYRELRRIREVSGPTSSAVAGCWIEWPGTSPLKSSPGGRANRSPSIPSVARSRSSPSSCGRNDRTRQALVHSPTAALSLLATFG